jgi:DNA-binding beta-propeller fold protein YncE
LAHQYNGLVTRWRASDGVRIGSYEHVVGPEPRAVVFDGANIWIANSRRGTVTKLRASNGARVDEYSVGNPPLVAGSGAAPNLLVFDGANVWVANQTNGTVTKK